VTSGEFWLFRLNQVS